MAKRALILGVTGQDGSILADLLLARGYEVHGVHRHTSLGNLSRVEHLLGKVALHRGDLTDVGSLYAIISEVKPGLLFNEADQDNVGWSHALPSLASRVTYGAVADLLEIVRQVVPHCRVFQPCSSTMFGSAPAPQGEETPFDPQSPYAVAKVAAYHLCRHYRRRHGLHVSCGILFNHTSVRQTEEYLPHKIAAGAVRVAAGRQEAIALGNLDTLVDVGCAREFMGAAIDMAEHPAPYDYVLASGAAFTVGALAAAALQFAGVTGDPSLRITRDPAFWTDAPLPTMRGDTRKARAAFGFRPQRFAGGLIRELVTHYRGVYGCA